MHIERVNSKYLSNSLSQIRRRYCGIHFKRELNQWEGVNFYKLQNFHIREGTICKCLTDKDTCHLIGGLFIRNSFTAYEFMKTGVLACQF